MQVPQMRKYIFGLEREVEQETGKYRIFLMLLGDVVDVSTICITVLSVGEIH